MMRRLLTKTVALMLAVALTLCATDKGPDAGNYLGTDNTVYSFIDLAAIGGSASVLAGTDDDVALLTLPFPFQFYGKTYTQICVSSNGLLNFGAPGGTCAKSSDFVNTDLTSTATPGDLPSVLPYWTDLTFQVSGSGAVYYRAQGAPGSRQFIVEWSNAYLPGSSNPVTFETILSEGKNQILFQYQSVDLGQGNPGSNGSLSTIGIRDAGGNTNGRQIGWSYNAAVVGNSSAILFTPPANGQTSVNTITSIPAGLTVTIDGTNVVTPTVVSWATGSSHTLAVTSPQTNGGMQSTFSVWSTGASTPQITVPAQSPGTTYTASFLTQYLLTTGINPPNAGTLTGGGWYNPGTSVSLQATAAAGYTLAYFSGDLSGSTNPQNVVMTGPKNVVANFQATANPVLGAAISAKANGSVTGQRIWTIRLSNTGLGTATGTQISGLTLTQFAGTPCSPVASVVSALPVVVGNIAPSSNATGQVTLDFSGCADPAARFTLKVDFSANGGVYKGSTTINNQAK